MENYHHHCYIMTWDTGSIPNPYNHCILLFDFIGDVIKHD